MRRAGGLFAGACISLVVLGSATPPSQAAFPGKPGRIVFSAAQPMNDRDLFVLTPGNDPVPLTDTPATDETDPAYSPDGSLIAFTLDDGTGPEVWIMAADGAGVATPLTDGPNASRNPSFSPDGHRVVYEHFAATDDIYVMDVDGSDEEPLVEGPQVDRNPVLSPDGRRLVFDSLIQFQGTRIFSIAPDGSGERRQLTESENVDSDPAFLPDSRRIVFRRGTPTDTAGAIWIMRANGTGERGLMPLDGYRLGPAVAPDSSRVLFLDQEAAQNTLFSMPLRGGSAVPLTEGLNVDFSPDWQPVPVRCGGRRATQVGTPGPDRLVGTPRRDVIAGRGGRDKIRGMAGRDVLCGGGGRDRLNGGRGRDRCIGGPRPDRARACERARSL
jgi:Tol biopolymer transport system component